MKFLLEHTAAKTAQVRNRLHSLVTPSLTEHTLASLKTEVSEMIRLAAPFDTRLAAQRAINALVAHPGHCQCANERVVALLTAVARPLPYWHADSGHTTKRRLEYPHTLARGEWDRLELLWDGAAMHVTSHHPPNHERTATLRPLSEAQYYLMSALQEDTEHNLLKLTEAPAYEAHVLSLTDRTATLLGSLHQHRGLAHLGTTPIWPVIAEHLAWQQSHGPLAAHEIEVAAGLVTGWSTESASVFDAARGVMSGQPPPRP